MSLWSCGSLHEYFRSNWVEPEYTIIMIGITRKSPTYVCDIIYICSPCVHHASTFQFPVHACYVSVPQYRRSTRYKRQLQVDHLVAECIHSIIACTIGAHPYHVQYASSVGLNTDLAGKASQTRAGAENTPWACQSTLYYRQFGLKAMLLRAWHRIIFPGFTDWHIHDWIANLHKAAPHECIPTNCVVVFTYVMIVVDQLYCWTNLMSLTF